MPSNSPISVVALGPDDAAEREEWLVALARVIDSNAYCLGSAVEAFEIAASEKLGIPHAIGLSSGTDALRLGLDALGVGPGAEVVVPAFTFFATASTVAHVGARPVFVDVDPDTLLMDTGAMSDAFTGSTRAVVPVHLYGQVAPMDVISERASAHGVRVLEDAAQAFGVRYRGTAAGALGDAGTFSFYPTKNLGAPGDAGMLVTRDPEIAASVRSLRMHGDSGGYRHEQLGYNARMDGFQAAVLSIRLARLDAMQAVRSRNAAMYLGELESRGLLDRIRPVQRVEGSEHCWHQFVVRVDDRDSVRQFLADRGIQSGIHYPGALPMQPAFSDLGHRAGQFPVAEQAGREVLALPVHHRLSENDCMRVVETLAAAVETRV